MKKLISLAAAIVLAATATTSSLFVPASAGGNSPSETDFYFGLEQTMFDVKAFDETVTPLESLPVNADYYIDSDGDGTLETPKRRDFNSISLPVGYSATDIDLGIYGYNMPTYATEADIPASVKAERPDVVAGDPISVASVTFAVLYDKTLANAGLTVGFTHAQMDTEYTKYTTNLQQAGYGAASAVGADAGQITQILPKEIGDLALYDNLPADKTGTIISVGDYTNKGLYFKSPIPGARPAEYVNFGNRATSIVALPLHIPAGLAEGIYTISIGTDYDNYVDTIVTRPSNSTQLINDYDVKDFKIIVGNPTTPTDPILGTAEISAKDYTGSTTVAYNGTAVGENDNVIGYAMERDPDDTSYGTGNKKNPERLYQYVPLNIAVKGDMPISIITTSIKGFENVTEGVDVYLADNSNARIYDPASEQFKKSSLISNGHYSAIGTASSFTTLPSSDELGIFAIISDFSVVDNGSFNRAETDANRALFKEGLEYIQVMLYVEYPADAETVEFDVVLGNKSGADLFSPNQYSTEFSDVIHTVDNNGLTLVNGHIELVGAVTPPDDHTIAITDVDGNVIADNTITLRQDGTRQLYAVDSLGHTAFTWSDNSTYVTVDANGLVTVTGNPPATQRVTITVACVDDPTVTDTLIISIARTATPVTPGDGGGWTPAPGGTDSSPETGEASGVVAALAVIGLAAAAAWTARKKR